MHSNLRTVSGLRKANNFNILLIVWIMLFFIAGCGQTKNEEIKSGRLSFVKELKYGNVGTHGSRGWYVSDRKFYVNGKSWSPKGIDVNDDLGSCEASPDESVEALKCSGFADLNETAYVLRMNGDKPDWIKASEMPYVSGKNLGEWTGEKGWLIFKDYYFNVETFERKAVKGLPDFPEEYFRAVSPDLETIVFEEYCFTRRLDLPPGVPHDGEIEKQCKLSNKHIENGILAYWLIDTKTGSVKILELKREKYPWLLRGNMTKREWLDNFRKNIVWEKDATGKYQLVFPN